MTAAENMPALPETGADGPRTPREAARYLNNYARQYSAGAFATPTAKDLADTGWHWWPQGVLAVSRRLTRTSTRTDFTGRQYWLRGGWQVITHLAAAPGARLPDLDRFDRIYAYIEDANVTTQLRAQGREIAAVKVSASSELIGCWGRDGEGHPYQPADTATLVQLPPPDIDLDAVRAEVAALDGWYDDYPFYSDGSWSALSVRGFNPADPTWGVKPSEMSKNWLRDHPEARNYTRCGWTTLAERVPATVDVVRSVPWWRGLERVRLLRMEGRGGKGGRLARHTDVTDRAAGVRDGQIARFHIPLITHPDITMTAWNLHGERCSAHLPPGTMWYLDARKPHAVDNKAGIDRIHLVVDVVADAAVRRAIAAGQDMAA